MLHKVLFLLEQGAPFEANWVGERNSVSEIICSLDILYREFITKLPFHPFLLEKDTLHYLALRTQTNAHLLELFVQSRVSIDVKAHPIIRDLLEQKEFKALYNLYQDLLTFSSAHWIEDRRWTWNDLIQNALPQLLKARDDEKSKLRDDQEGGLWAAEHLLTFKDILNLPPELLKGFLHFKDNVDHTEQVVCSPQGSKYLSLFPQKTPQLRIVFNSLSSHGKNHIIETLSSGGWFD